MSGFDLSSTEIRPKNTLILNKDAFEYDPKIRIEVCPDIWD